MPELRGVEIRECKKSDLSILERAMPDNGYHRKRYAGQKTGDHTYLIAMYEGQPVGHLYITWTGPSEQEVKKYANYPSVSALKVVENMRSQGVGTQLMDAAESLIRSKGFKVVGLGVGVENLSAQKFYNRLGYRDWGRGPYVSSWREKESDENSRLIEEKSNRLIKEL